MLQVGSVPAVCQRQAMQMQHGAAAARVSSRLNII